MTQDSYEEITPGEVWHLVNDDSVRLVDVRTPEEYHQSHIPGTLLMPMNEIMARFERELSPEERIVLICAHGVRSEMAAQFLASYGYHQVATMVGGMAAYPGDVVTDGAGESSNHAL